MNTLYTYLENHNMNAQKAHHIGTKGQQWAERERRQWLEEQSIKRSYHEEVVRKLEQIQISDSPFTVEKYSALRFQPQRYPLFVVKNAHHIDKPTALITGGVHGYETSGVQGALNFLDSEAALYSDEFNLVVAPCISPWAYETINRWNPYAIDPNRSFVADSPADESASLMAMIKTLNTKIHVHIDLHETTDTDNTEFRPALSARDNQHHDFWEIPDGFYLVGDSNNPCDDFQHHIIESVSDVTHIAPSDARGRIIGEPISQHGVINYPTEALGLCTGFTQARFNTTTEVYPDSPIVDAQNCILAQVTAACSALDFAARFN